MRRILFLGTLAIFSLTGLTVTSIFAQTTAQAKDAERLAVVLSRNIPPYLDALEGFKEVLNNRGYRFSITSYELKGKPNEAESIVREIRRLNPALILTIGTESTKAISGQITEIPIIFSMSLNSNLVDGGKGQKNLTGASMIVPIDKQLKELVNIVPRVKNIGIICNPAYYSQHIAEWEKIAAEQMNIKVVVRFAKNESEFIEVGKSILPEVDAFLFVPDEVILSPRTAQFILLESFRYNKPVIAPSLRFVEDGALFALGSDYKDIGRQSAELAIQIFQGKNASDLPVTEARTTHLYLSLRTTKQMGIPIPEEVISRAEKIIE